MGTYVYVDGFNLYYGLLKGSEHKWLNLEALFADLLPTKHHDIVKIRYFTAAVDARAHDLDLPIRQAAYLRALATLPRLEIHRGNFLTSCIRAPEVEVDPATGHALKVNGTPVIKLSPTGSPVMKWVSKSEEKGSDVNLAAHLLRDAYRGDSECAVVVSNDSDLLTPIQMVKADLGIKVGLIPPRPRGSLELKNLASFTKSIRTHQLVAAQFPDALTDRVGNITKPQGW